MAMTKAEITALKNIAHNIRYFASLEHASFSSNEEEDAKIKEKIKPYMMWLELRAIEVDDVIKSQNMDSFDKRQTLEGIRRE